MKGLLLRVGIDRGTGGCLAPIFEDGSFEYVPIPEKRNSSERRLYKNLSGENIQKFLPSNLHSLQPHCDPEFETYTYGDPKRPKRNQLSELEEGDLLIFYVGLEPQDFPDRNRLYVIGYFTVSDVFDFQDLTDAERREVFERFPNNAHSKIGELNDDLVVVKGDPENSELLKSALLLGDGGNPEVIIPALENVTGYEGGIQRAIGHWIDKNTHRKKHFRKTLKWLENGFSSLIKGNTALYSYVLASDTGFAPNVKGGYCTLACCKPRIRSKSYTSVGDWVIGTNTKEYNRRELMYAMRVSETLTFDEFYHNERFECKRPENDPLGDNIYFRDDSGEFVHDPKSDRHTSNNKKADDTQTDRVLVSSLFWYFGENSPEMPLEFQEDFIKEGPGCTKVEDKHKLRDFVRWLESNYRVGVHGSPRDKSGKSETEEGTC